MKFKRAITLGLISTLICSSVSFAIPSTSIGKKVEVYKGQVNLPNHEWRDKIEYTVGKDNIPFGYDSEYNYSDSDYQGTLKATKVTITPKQKIENKYYVTEYKNFNKNSVNTYATKNDNNFSSTYYVDEDGFKGHIPRKNVSWIDNWVTNRTEYIQTEHETGWITGSSPNRYSYTYYDPKSNQNININLDKIRDTSVQTSESYKYSESYGNRYNYSQNNETLGYMSDNTNKYWSDLYDFSKPPRRPSDYYGNQPDKDNWELLDCDWDESRVYSADELSGISEIRQNLAYLNGSYWWKSSNGNYNKYRKGVYLKYRKKINVYKYRTLYGGNISLPNYIKDYTGTANYGGTLSKQVEKTNYTSDYWDVNITYEGNVDLKDVQVSGKVIPSVSQKGGKITFDINTRYYPNKIQIFIPSELQSQFGKSVITMNIEERAYLNTKHSEILSLDIDETLDKEGNKLREPYKFKVRATRSDGKFAETILKLDVSGTILDNLKTRVIN